LLKDQSKWRTFCDTINGGLSKRSKINEIGGYSSPSTSADEGLEVGVDGFISSIGRKAAKRKLQQKANNTVVDLVTNHFSTMGTTGTEKVKIFRKLGNRS